eukprot:5998209-Pleurochrysis_carterae.AAC.1
MQESEARMMATAGRGSRSGSSRERDGKSKRMRGRPPIAMGNRACLLAAIPSLAGAAGQARMSERHRSTAESCWRAEPL